MTRRARQYFKSLFADLRFFLDLVVLYGPLKTIDLYVKNYINSQKKAAINTRISELVEQMAKDQRVDGSAICQGWLYHNYALPERGLKAHRTRTERRVHLLKRNLPIKGAGILDIGCSSGGVSLGLALLGASSVVGIDYDVNAIRVARAVAEKYDIDNVAFEACSMFDYQYPRMDIIIWLSQWMWVVKEKGIDYGKDLLFEIPTKVEAQYMVFESAADDGMAAISGMSQDKIAGFLRECTPFAEVASIGAFRDGWRSSGKERIVYVCSKPITRWQGYQAVVTRSDRTTVIKTFSPEYLWAKDIEVNCLRKLQKYKCVPTIVDEGDDWIKMQWVGWPVTHAEQLQQLPEIARILRDEQIIHRDICPENLLFSKGQLHLIDFGWAIVEGVEPPVLPPSRLGRGFYDPEQRNDLDAVSRVMDWMRKREACH